jgi:hypothetical protein
MKTWLYEELGAGFTFYDHRLAALIHMHLLDADDLRAAVPEAP